MDVDQYYNPQGFHLLEEDFFQRKVVLDERGWPEAMLLPNAEDFIEGSYISDCKTRGCLLGWAYAAFGVRFSDSWVGTKTKECWISDVRDGEDKIPDQSQRRQERLARRFAQSVLRTAGYSTTLSGVECLFDRKFEELDGPFAKAVAHAWRVEAWKRGYDVKASEPEWKP